MPISLPLNDALGTLFVVLVIMLLAPLASEKLRLPSLFGLLLSGFLVGPSCLKLIGGGPEVEHIGSIGAAYVFFLVGASIDGAELSRGKGLKFGARLLLSSAALGFGASYLILRLAPLPSLFVALLFASETALSPSALEAAGLAESPAAGKVASSLSLTDLARASLFALLAALARPSSIHWSLSLGLTLAAALIITLLMPRAASLFFKRAKPNEAVELLFILLLVFASAYLCSLAGIEASTGTFLAGLLLGRFIPSGSALGRRLGFLGDLVFLPLFLIVFGMDIDLGAALASPALPGLVALCLCLAFCSRLVAFLPEGGERAPERLALYGLSLGQGGATLALVFLARRLDLAGPAFALAAALACIASSFAAPLIAKRASAGQAQAKAEGSVQAARHPRIMAALANPSSLRGLMELAMALRKKESREPLLPLAVVSEAEESEPELAKAENLLAKAIVQANAAGVAVSPVTKVAVNAAEGIKKAQGELGTSVLILGWNRSPRLSQALSGNVAARVIEGTRELVLVAKLARPLRDCQRAALVLPPLVERHPGFEGALSAILPLLSYTGAHLTIYSTSPSSAAAKQARARLRSRGQAQLVELGSWKELAKAAKSSPPNLFIVLSPRPGKSAWHPAIEKLPHLFADDFPEASILLCYLAEAPAPEGAKASPAARLERDLFEEARDAGRVMLGMEETAITDGIRALLSRDYGEDRRALGRLSSRFTEIAQREPIELEPGVLLLHAHVPGLECPRVYFGARPEGFRLLALEEPVRVLVILCAPEGQPPEAHLAVLGELSRLFKDRGLRERLLEKD